jgi:hypothetical protein
MDKLTVLKLALKVTKLQKVVIMQVAIVDEVANFIISE